MHPNPTGRPPVQFADDRDPSLISASKVAEQLHLQLAELSRMGRLDLERLTANPESANIQGLLGNIVRAFAAAAAVFMNDAAASAWMTEPVRAFRDKTALALVAGGRTEDVLRYLQSIESGFVG